jgi:serine/threonine protein kinase
MRPRGTCRLFASLAPARLIRIALDISEAMRYCHSLKPEALAHRDLKSVNIVVSEDGRAKVTDFGTAKLLRDTVTTHTMKGTVQYASPETFGVDESSDWDWPPCDVYSFGVILWELFSNKRPPGPISQRGQPRRRPV